MKMRFLHSILCIFVVGSVLAVTETEQPGKPTTVPQPGNTDPNVVPEGQNAGGSGGKDPQTQSQVQTDATGSGGQSQKGQELGKPGATGSAVGSPKTQSPVQPGVAESVGQGKQTQETNSEASTHVESGQAQQQNQNGGEAAGKSLTSPGPSPQNALSNSSGTMSTTSVQKVTTEMQAGDPSQQEAEKSVNLEQQKGHSSPKATASLPAEEKKTEAAQLPVQHPAVTEPKEDEEEKEEEKEKGDEEEEDTKLKVTEDQRNQKQSLQPGQVGPKGQPDSNGRTDSEVAPSSPGKTPKEAVPTMPPVEQNEQGPVSDVSVQLPTGQGADGAPGKDGMSASGPKVTKPALPEPSTSSHQKPDAPDVDVKQPDSAKNTRDQGSASDSEDQHSEEEEDDDDEEEEEDEDMSGVYDATQELPEHLKARQGRVGVVTPREGSDRRNTNMNRGNTVSRARRNTGSGSSSSATQTEDNPAGTQQPGKAGEDVSQQGPESGSSNSQAPQEPTLETLVRTGSISEKQEIVTAFLKKDLADGPLRKIFNYNDNSKTLETCRHLTQRKPKVCKAGNIKTEAPSANVDLNRLVGEYLTHSVCTVEAALNQMYHSVHQGEYISNEIHAALKILSNVMRMNTTMRERYGDSEHILENLLQLFHAAEKALVSQSVQTVLYNRWALLDSVLCAVASGESNEVLDKINMDASNSSATAVVNLERFINSSTEVFVKAYKPFAELLRVIENGVLIKALELNKNEFREQAERVVQTITERHVPGVSPAALNSLAQVPHAGLNTNDIQRITGRMGNSVSLVQRGQDVTQAGAVSPTTALRTAVLSLNIFKVSGNHIAPEIDESAVRTMVRSALLSFSEEEMVSKLIVAPQAALRVIYETIKLLVPIPAENGATAVTSDDANSRIKEIERLMDENFRQVNQAVSRSLSTSGRANLPEAALIQTAVNHLGGAAPAKTDLQTRATFTVDSRQEGANLEDNTNEYIEEQQFQKNMDNLVHIKSYSSATLAGTVGILALALVVIF